MRYGTKGIRLEQLAIATCLKYSRNGLSNGVANTTYMCVVLQLRYTISLTLCLELYRCWRSWGAIEVFSSHSNGVCRSFLQSGQYNWLTVTPCAVCLIFYLAHHGCKKNIYTLKKVIQQIVFSENIWITRFRACPFRKKHAIYVDNALVKNSNDFI